MSMSVVLGGSRLGIEDLVRIARDPSVRVELAPDADARVRRGEELIQRIVAEYKEQYRAFKAGERTETPRTVYGVTTGFGEFKDQAIHPDHLEELQRNLLESHTVGVGENVDPDDRSNYYPAEVVRGALTTRLNAFLRGNSGVRMRLVEVVRAMLNTGVVPLVPLRGSVGASGDLCPLSHLFVTLLGEGSFYLAAEPDKIHAASELGDVLRRELHDLDDKEMAPTYKEGLALINGANFSAAMLALAAYDAAALADAADIAASFTLEVLCGCTPALDPKVHEARGHEGQKVSAANIAAMLDGSTLVGKAGAVQDAYSLRCAPQVHGASRGAIGYVWHVAETEINAATDNPLFFPGEGEREAYSAGNFHGQPVALAADFLSIAVAELANISERRTQMLLDANHNRQLPPNLTTRPGVNSGLMIAQYTAASLVSENKVLSHPASVDSIPTSANSEDHVSMSTHAARKLRTILGNAQSVIAIELLAAAQGADWRIGMNVRPVKPKEPSAPMTMEEAQEQADAFGKVAPQSVAAGLAPKLQLVYGAVRKRVPSITKDQRLDGHIRALRALVMSGSLRP